MIFSSMISLLVLKLSTIFAITASASQKPAEKRSILSYPARCGVSKISYRKSTVMYKWEVNGLVNFLDYVKQFDESFVHETDNVKFTSPDDISGLWKFKVQSTKSPVDKTPFTFVSAKYTYEENSKNQRMNIGVKIKIMHGPTYSTANEFVIRKPSDKYIQKIKTITDLITTPKTAAPSASKTTSNARRTLPAWFTQNSSEEDSDNEDDDVDIRTKEAQALNTSRGTKKATENFVEINRVIVSFDTGNIQPLLDSLRKSADNSNDENSAVDFTFIINYFIPNEPVVSEQMKCYIGNFTHQLHAYPGGSKQSGGGLTAQSKMKQSEMSVLKLNKTEPGIEKTEKSIPPFMSSLESIFETGEFSDMSVAIQGASFPVHRIFLANSSPYLASKIRKSMNLAEFMPFEDSVGQNATLEILRYIYTGQVRNLALLAEQVIIGAHQVGLVQLERKCIDLLMNDINIGNAIMMYSLAKDVESEALTKAAVEVIRQNKQAVVSQSKEFQKLASKYPAIIFDLFLS